MGSTTQESSAPAVEQLRGQLASKIAEAKALTAQWAGKEDQMPAEVDTKLQGILGEADVIKARVMTQERLAQHDGDLSQPVELPLSWRQASPKEGNVPTDRKSWRNVEVDTPFGTKKAIRYNVPIAAEAKNYSDAFELYLRKGKEGLQQYPTEAKALSSASDTAGGFFISPDMMGEVLKKIATLAIVRSLARVISTSSNLVKWPRIKYTTDNKYTSGVRLTWTGESPASNTTARVTDQVLGEINIPVHTAMASQLVSSDLIEDSAFDIMGISADLMSEAFALGEDDAFLNGNGAGRPLGLFTNVANSDDSQYIPYVVSGTSAAITTSGDDHSGKRLLDVYYAVPSQYRTRGTWLMNSATLKTVDNLVDAQKRPIVQALTVASIMTGEPTIIKGKRIGVDEFTPDIGANTFPLLFGDVSGYCVVDRVGFSIQRYNELYSEYNQVLLLSRKRVGGAVIEPYRMRVMKCGTS